VNAFANSRSNHTLDHVFPKEKQTVNKFMQLALVGIAAFVLSNPALVSAADGSAISFSGAIGAGLVVLGAAFGISRLGAAAVESMARQPEVKQNVFVITIIVAALIEGFTFYAIFVCSQQNPFIAH
jgi:F-type H+-transporting ATPase subunit c